MKEILDRIFERNRLNRRLHWTTIASEKSAFGHYWLTVGDCQWAIHLGHV
jgi:hypothetical protein